MVSNKLRTLAADLQKLPVSRDSMKEHRDAAADHLVKLAEEIEKYKLTVLNPEGIFSAEAFGKLGG